MKSTSGVAVRRIEELRKDKIEDDRRSKMSDSRSSFTSSIEEEEYSKDRKKRKDKKKSKGKHKDKRKKGKKDKDKDKQKKGGKGGILNTIRMKVKNMGGGSKNKASESWENSPTNMRRTISEPLNTMGGEAS
jgi:hypothetical protein